MNFGMVFGASTMGGDFGLAWDAIQGLVVLGVTIGIVLAVVSGAFKIGWKFAPWICAVALAIWFFA